VADDSADDPTGGLYDRATNRQSNEIINQNSTELAKGLQSAFGKSDRDAEDAQKMAEGGSSGRDRYQAAERNEKKLVAKMRTELATLPPAQAQKLLSTMPAEVKAKVLGQDQ
jgi:seryl-tRNA synthetase